MPLFNAFPSDSDDASRASMCSLYYWSILNEVSDGACKTGTTALKLNTGFLILIILEITQVAFKLRILQTLKNPALQRVSITFVDIRQLNSFDFLNFVCFSIIFFLINLTKILFLVFVYVFQNFGYFTLHFVCIYFI